PEPEYHADNTLVFFNFGWDLTQAIRSAGFAVRVLVTEQFKNVLTNRQVEPADTDPQFDIPSMWRSVVTDDLDVVADARTSDLYGFSPAHQYVTWECIKSVDGN
ncbi:MAG: methyltransferase type 11, partial [Actinomycetota bacterium]